jgi:hypothetical protein
MKKKTNIRTVIRKIVREEVAMAIHEVITELKQPIQQASQPQPKKKIVEEVPYKKYSENSVLNDVLNETASEGEWRTLGGETQTTNNMGDIMNKSYSNLMNSSPADVPITVDGQQPDFLKKDYSKLVKAMGEKANQTRGN